MRTMAFNVNTLREVNSSFPMREARLPPSHLDPQNSEM